MTAPMFKHTVRKAHKEVSKSEEWSATIAGYDVLVYRRENEHVEISIYPERRDHSRLGLVKMHPRSLQELEALAEIAPTVLPEIARALRAALGTDDLRATWEKTHDELMEKIASRRR
jgi:hypothetical protein